MSEVSAGKTLLLVEDEALIALDEQALLQKHGFKVKTVHSGEKALQAVQSSDIDLVLMDIDLGPGKLDGTEAAEAILAAHNLPIVFLTNHTEKEMVSKVKGLTRYGYVLKSAGEFVLVESILMALELFDAHERRQKENRERKSAERKAEETAEFYRHLMENCIDAVYLLSETGKVLAVNSVACRMIGYSREELNHRVKNNLMLISSFISMKNEEMGDLVDLSDLQRRIDAVRIVHEQLNRSADITSINLRDYINALLSAVFSFGRRKVGTELRIDVESLPTKTAIAVLLILIEIATNALKHAFSDDTEPLFTVTFEAELEAGMYTMTVSNNGRPFPRDIDVDHPDTMGLRLVAALIDQIDGSLQLQKLPCPVFSIRFPMN